MKKVLYSLLAVAGLFLTACDPSEINPGEPCVPVTAETFKYTVTPVMQDGKVTNRVLLETQSPVTCSWNNEVATVVGNSVTTTLFHTGANEITVHVINQDGSTFDKVFTVNVDVMAYEVDELYGIFTNNTTKTWEFTKYGVTWGDPTAESDFSMYTDAEVVGWSDALGLDKEYIGSTMKLSLKGTTLTLYNAEGKELSKGTFNFVRATAGESLSPSCTIAHFTTVGTFIPFANPWWGPATCFTQLELFYASEDKIIFTFNDGNIWCWVFEARD